MKRTAVVWSPGYELPWPDHVFPTAKYRRAHEAIAAAGSSPADRLRPERVGRDDLLRVHTRRHVEEIERLTAEPGRVAQRFEIPLTRAVVEAVELHCGGTRLAIEAAMERGAALNLGGGFHRAFADRGEGFCFYNDVAVGLRAAQHRGSARRATIVDVDLHQGNGTASIFTGDPDVTTYSIHQEDLYPVPKAASTVDVGLPGGTGDAIYLEALGATLPAFLDASEAELLVYVAGADPFEHDRLGDLRITREGLRRRDEFVLAEAARRRMRVAAVLAGGYAERVEDVVAIHVDLWRALERFAIELDACRG